MRTTAPLNKENWKEVEAAVGDQMWNLIKEKFEYPPDETKLKWLCFDTMRRSYKAFRNRLHAHYKAFLDDEERKENPPEDLEREQWERCIEYFVSEDFKKISAQNSVNAKKRKQKHTTGNVSFAEFEKKMVDPIIGDKLPLDEIWFRQHARKTAKGDLEWADDESKRLGEKLLDLVNKSMEEGAEPMTRDQIIDEAIGPKSGYRRGFGYGKEASTKVTRACDALKEQHQQDKEKLKDKVAETEEVVAELKNELQAQRANQEERERRISDDLAKTFQEQMQTQFATMFGPTFQYSFPSFSSQMTGGSLNAS